MNFKAGDVIQVIEADWSNSVLLVIAVLEKEYQVAVLYNKLNGNIGALYKLTKRYTDKDYYRV